MKAPYKTKRLFNLAFFEEIVVKDRAIAKTQYQVPFRQLPDAQQGKSVLNKELLVEVSGDYSKRLPGLKALLDGGAA